MGRYRSSGLSWVTWPQRDWRRVGVTTGKRWQDGASTAWVLLSYLAGESYAAALRNQSAPGRQDRGPAGAGARAGRARAAFLYQSAGRPARLAAGHRGGVGRESAGRGLGQ